MPVESATSLVTLKVLALTVTVAELLALTLAVESLQVNVYTLLPLPAGVTT